MVSTGEYPGLDIDSKSPLWKPSRDRSAPGGDEKAPGRGPRGWIWRYLRFLFLSLALIVSAVVPGFAGAANDSAIRLSVPLSGRWINTEAELSFAQFASESVVVSSVSENIDKFWGWTNSFTNCANWDSFIQGFRPKGVMGNGVSLHLFPAALKRVEDFCCAVYAATRVSQFFGCSQAGIADAHTSARDNFISPSSKSEIDARLGLQSISLQSIAQGLVGFAGYPYQGSGERSQNSCENSYWFPFTDFGHLLGAIGFIVLFTGCFFLFTDRNYIFLPLYIVALILIGIGASHSANRRLSSIFPVHARAFDGKAAILTGGAIKRNFVHESRRPFTIPNIDPIETSADCSPRPPSSEAYLSKESALRSWSDGIAAGQSVFVGWNSRERHRSIAEAYPNVMQSRWGLSMVVLRADQRSR